MTRAEYGANLVLERFKYSAVELQGVGPIPIALSEADLVRRIADFSIETQSWGYVSTGTRFKVFHTPGTPRNVWEKIDDAALVHQLTGVTPTVALHIPWDMVDDFTALSAYATDAGISIGSISPNLFQDDDYRLGSLTNVDPGIRRKALEHAIACVDIMRQTNSTTLSMWLADGTNYPGQGDFRTRRAWLREGLGALHDALDPDMRMILEYKLFEPAFYHTDVADWGQSLSLCRAIGERAQVLVDLGHHALGVNIEHIVATLIAENRLGGFDLNAKRYADDDLMVGTTNPYELFLIMAELTGAEADSDPAVVDHVRQVLYKIDQCAMIEDKLPAMIRSIEACQIAFTKSLLIDRQALIEAQLVGDVVWANSIVEDAFLTDVRPLIAIARETLGVQPNPLATYRRSDAPRRRRDERVGTPAGW